MGFEELRSEMHVKSQSASGSGTTARNIGRCSDRASKGAFSFDAPFLSGLAGAFEQKVMVLAGILMPQGFHFL